MAGQPEQGTVTRYLLDTHTIFWFEQESPRLSANAAAVFQRAEDGEAVLIQHPIVLAELGHVFRKHGMPHALSEYIRRTRLNDGYAFASIDIADLLAMDRLTDIPEMHDRLIAACAIRLGCPIVTYDASLRRCPQVQSVW